MLLTGLKVTAEDFYGLCSWSVCVRFEEWPASNDISCGTSRAINITTSITFLFVSFLQTHTLYCTLLVSSVLLHSTFSYIIFPPQIISFYHFFIFWGVFLLVRFTCGDFSSKFLGFDHIHRCLRNLRMVG